MKRLHQEPDGVLPARTSAEVLSLPEADHDAQAVALDAARAEFRAAWEAKRARAERLRGRVVILDQVEPVAKLLAKLLLLITALLVVMGLLDGAFESGVIRATSLGMAACVCLARLVDWTRERVYDAADRLEAGVVR